MPWASCDRVSSWICELALNRMIAPVVRAKSAVEPACVRTHAGSTADFALTTGAIIRLSANSQIQLETLSQEAHGIPSNGQLPAVTDRTQITLDQGQLNSKVRKLSANSSYVVRT